MENIVGTVKFTLNKQWKYSCSSSVTKSANSVFNGRGASIFRISADYCINHDSISFIS